MTKWVKYRYTGGESKETTFKKFEVPAGDYWKKITVKRQGDYEYVHPCDLKLLKKKLF
jgi:hypothetical protein